MQIGLQHFLDAFVVQKKRRVFDGRFRFEASDIIYI